MLCRSKHAEEQCVLTANQDSRFISTQFSNMQRVVKASFASAKKLGVGSEHGDNETLVDIGGLNGEMEYAKPF